MVQEIRARIGESENSLALVNLNSKLKLKFESLFAVQYNAAVFEFKKMRFKRVERE